MATNLRASLSVFRIVFGVVMIFSVLRTIAKGWVKTLYIDPTFYFSYYGFEWVKPLGTLGMYALFILMVISAFGILIGLYYRINAVIFFISFTYVELIDKANYLNHYYLVSLISFLLIFIPAHYGFSLDCLRKPSLLKRGIHIWAVHILKIQIGIVYFFAGVAKLNPDWLLEALPLKIWLPAKAEVPIIGTWLLREEVSYLFSWFGALYDLSVAFLLLYSRTRIFAYVAVIVFHIATAVLFPIGVFPYVMIGFTLIFFPATFHEKIIAQIKTLLNRLDNALYLSQFFKAASVMPDRPRFVLGKKWLTAGLSLYLLWQLLMPFRYLLYPNKLFWSEQGYRFSWRVMLMEKAGQAFFYVKNLDTGRTEEVRNSDYLTPHQEQMMSTQPDMILQFAHYLKQQYALRSMPRVTVTTECYVTLNGTMSRLLIDPSIDLTQQTDGLAHKYWISDFKN